MPRLVVLSPHLDDAAFSCGGIIAHHTQSGTCDVVTVFAGKPADPTSSDMARSIVAQMGNPPDPVGLRLEEDAAALAQLSATGHHLSHLDVVYRAPDTRIFLTHDETVADAARGDEALARLVSDEIADAFPAGPDLQLLGPLGVGNHVDHLHVHEACRLLAARGYSVAYYEDFPYSLSREALRRRLERCENAHAELFELDEAALSRRLEAMSCYESQAQLLFPDPSATPAMILERIAMVVRSQAASLSQANGLAERIWRLPHESRAAR